MSQFLGLRLIEFKRFSCCIISGLIPQFLGLASVLIRNLRDQIAATRQGCPWILTTSTRATGRRRSVGRRSSRSCPNGLPASDYAEGETSLRRALRPWPWATRRRIHAHLRRLLAVESAAKTTSAGQTAGGLRRSPINYARSPTDFGPFCPMNCESESRNHARPGRAGRLSACRNFWDSGSLNSNDFPVA